MAGVVLEVLVTEALGALAGVSVGAMWDVLVARGAETGLLGAVGDTLGKSGGGDTSEEEGGGGELHFGGDEQVGEKAHKTTRFAVL